MKRREKISNFVKQREAYEAENSEFITPINAFGM